MKNIVVADPTGRMWPGSLVTDDQARPLRARGIVLLPCEPSLFMISGVGGFAKREWGSGWPLDTSAPRMTSPLTMFLLPEAKRIHWAVRLMPMLQPGMTMEEWKTRTAGTLSFATDQSQHGSRVVPGFKPDEGSREIQPRELGELDANGGWNWIGKGDIALRDEAIYGFAIYGAAAGLRLVWAAVSATYE